MYNGEIYLYYAIGVCIVICLMLVFLALSFDTPEILHERQACSCTVCLYLLGYTPSTVKVRREVTIPLIFTKKYKDYNLIQNKSGLDLTKWRGRRAVMYSCETAEHTRENVPLLISVYMLGDRIIAGDIRVGEKVLPLCAKENLPYDI